MKTASISDSTNPRVVIAGVPIRIPEVTNAYHQMVPYFY
jgi:hypothetical protein